MKAIERIIDVITFLASDHDYHGITEISDKLHINKSTLHRILTTLEKHEWVLRNPNARNYKLGDYVLEIGTPVSLSFDIRQMSLPYLYKLSETTSETALLTLRVGLERIFLEEIRGDHQIEPMVELGKRHPLWYGASGKAILAFLKENELNKVFDSIRKLEPITLASGQMLDLDRLRKQIEDIRGSGFSVSVGEQIVGTFAVAAPIFDSTHKPIGSLCIAGPHPRFNINHAKNFGVLVAGIAKDLSSQLSALKREEEAGV